MHFRKRLAHQALTQDGRDLLELLSLQRALELEHQGLHRSATEVECHERLSLVHAGDHVQLRGSIVHRFDDRCERVHQGAVQVEEDRERHGTSGRA